MSSPGNKRIIGTIFVSVKDGAAVGINGANCLHSSTRLTVAVDRGGGLLGVASASEPQPPGLARATGRARQRGVGSRRPCGQQLKPPGRGVPTPAPRWWWVSLMVPVCHGVGQGGGTADQFPQPASLLSCSLSQDSPGRVLPLWPPSLIWGQKRALASQACWQPCPVPCGASALAVPQQDFGQAP